MGTRATFGFRIGGVEKITYNHSDGYPEGAGECIVADLVDAVRSDRMGEMKRKAADLRVIDGETPPTAEDIERCRVAGTIDTGVGDQSENDWYCLLRGAQPTRGGAWKILECGAMLGYPDGHDLPYGYVIDFDAMAFEVHERKCKPAPSHDAIVGTLPLANIDEWRSTWIADLFPEDAEDE